MKKNISLIVVLFLTIFSAANAQIAAGTKAVSAGFGLWGQRYQHSETKYRNTELNGSISGSYFILENLSVGLGFDIGRTRNYQKSASVFLGESEYETIQSNYTVNIFSRYYHPIWDNKLFVLGQANAGMGRLKSDNSYSNSGITDTNKGNLDTYSAGVNLGLAYFITPKFSIETSVLHFKYTNYKYQDRPDLGNYTSRDYDYGLIGNLNLSAQFYF
ncbi:hypothetical protein SAMN05421780_101321 [Flexibacter flexilis DSM 6793]|uniref:Outer membrane protein beta-barrel domain-containing protein n=1 Tax=Flexibacter flexilis DSM 6793 TaxID=927664 RepID=A0A1I1DM95_9BACT|nr:outer membrane beta-barrel protein [Flexibacter flexilis]SFB75977.1 hypothetical protein SAMN05421780_101321 [Flexibacter flexilis DSM 6793]